LGRLGHPFGKWSHKPVTFFIHRLYGEIGNPNGFHFFKIGKPKKQSIQANYGICKKLKCSVWVIDRSTAIH